MSDKESETVPTTALPDEISEWAESGDPEPRDFIIQADLPKRSVQVEYRNGKAAFTGVETMSASDDRASQLESLLHSIEACISHEAKLLKTAGAIVVRAIPDELRMISKLPGIREIRTNRTISGRPKN